MLKRAQDKLKLAQGKQNVVNNVQLYESLEQESNEEIKFTEEEVPVIAKMKEKAEKDMKDAANEEAYEEATKELAVAEERSKLPVYTEDQVNDIYKAVEHLETLKYVCQVDNLFVDNLFVDATQAESLENTFNRFFTKEYANALRPLTY